MKITAKGQVTIPIELREQLGLYPDTYVQFEVDGNSLRIRKLRNSGKKSRGARMVDRLRGKYQLVMTTDEIMELTRGEK